MGGVSVGGGSKGGKKAVDQEINMIPFIDLLMVTISFLLITAVWSSMARINANAQVPSSKAKTTEEKKEKQKEPSVLHVRVSDKDKKFKLEWQTGNKTDEIASIDMEADSNGRYPKLEDAIKNAYTTGQGGDHNLHGDDLAFEASAANDHGANALNQAILHVDNAFPFSEVVKVIDAVYVARRYVCFAPRPECCDKPDKGGHSASCKSAADDVPAFNVAFSAN